MNKIFARVKGSTDEYQILRDDVKAETIYSDIERIVREAECVKYDFNTVLDDDMFYCIDKFSEQDYYPIFLKESMYSIWFLKGVTRTNQ